MNARSEVVGDVVIDPGPGSSRAFAWVALSLLAVLGWIVAWYWPTASEIASIWWRSETFAHGLVVLPICAWLIWRKRDHVGAIPPRPVAWLAIPVALAALAWMLGQLVNVNALSHTALVTMVVLSFVGVLGWRLSRVFAFALLFLFFGIPVGEFLLPTLMHYTAEFTVAALRFSGVPVYQEGLFFIVPNGRWSVVEACSGLRYLIASLMIGTLYAYLNYVSLKRRLLFVGVSILVPIVANWLRAYFIVMLGYHTDNRVAAGVDHLIYGWLFFGVVIMLMFWIGSRWQEAPRALQPQVPASIMERRGAVGLVHALPIFLALAAFPPALSYIEAPVQPFNVALQTPAPADGWELADEVFHEYLPRYAGYRGHLYQAYRHRDGGVVGLYIAYYAEQREDHELIAWRNRLTTRDEDSRWMQVVARRDQMPVGEVNRTVIGDQRGRLAIWHWYWSNGRVVLTDYMAKALLAMDQLTGQPDDAAFVGILVPAEERGDEQRVLIESFLRDHAQGIQATLEGAEVVR